MANPFGRLYSGSKNTSRPLIGGNSMKRPTNIVFILADDMGAWAMGCAGNDEIITPNLDRIAKEGIRFTDFFCTSPVCSPARASILTGRIPSQHGVHDWLCGGSVAYDKLPKELKKGKDKNEHPIEFLKGMRGYTDELADNGYDCMLSGKWHLGDSMTPQKSFSEWYTIGGGGCAYFHPDVIEDGEISAKHSEYVTDLFTDKAVEYINERDGQKPFYLSVHYTAPHGPWFVEQHKAETRALYADCPFDSIPKEVTPPSWLEPTVNWDIRRQEILTGYYAAITDMDKGIGRILDALDEKTLLDDTLVIFTADNGMNMGHHGLWGKGNATFPMNMFDTSVKVPYLMMHRGQLPEGVTCYNLVSQYDIMPTLLEYVGIPYHDESLPGRSFSPILNGDKLEDDAVVVYDEYGPVRMIRTRDWKYVHRNPYGPHELYDHVNDPDENKNLYGMEQYEKIAVDMKRQLTGWFDRYVDPELDGNHEPVSGHGQYDLAGCLSDEACVYKPHRSKRIRK